jgi:thiosulfate dehydrogenase
LRRAVVILALIGCSGGGAVPAVEHGAALFRDPGFSGSRFNSFSCATCHTTTPGDAAPRIGGTLHDTAFRAAWWGGYAPRLLDAVSFCNVYFMRGVPIDPGDPRGRALYEYLVSISPTRPAPARPLSIVENVSPVPRGDPRRGREVYDAVCRDCHGQPHSGSGRLATSVAIIPEASIGFAREFQVDPALVVVEKVRHGQFFGVGGNMPLFSREALSDADLGALLAYLGL